MTTAEKLAKIAENELKVHAAGKAQGGTDWLYYAKTFSSLFAGAVFPENTEVVIRVKGEGVTSYANMFQNVLNIKKLKMVSETQETVLRMSQFLTVLSHYTKTLELVDFTEFNKKFSDSLNLFYNQTKLKKILGALDLSSCTNTTNSFSSCAALEEIEFERGTIYLSISFANCSLLTSVSIQSIIDGLADLTGGTAQVLTLHSTITDNLTTEQYSQIWAKNWTTE